MKLFSNLKLGNKLILQSVTVLFLILAIAFTYLVITIRNNDVAEAYASIEDLSGNNAAIVEEALNQPFTVARSLSQVFLLSNNISTSQRRDFFNSLMREFLEKNEKLLGIWAVFEPDRFDGMDDYYSGKRPDTDSSGRYISYVYRDGEKLFITAVSGYDQPGAGDFYLLARDSGEETILEPFSYEIDGKSILMTTLAVPIKAGDGSVIGVVGVDISLDALQSTAFSKGDYSSAYMFVTSNIGSLVIHPDADMVMKNQGDITSAEESAKTLPAIAGGQVLSITGKSTVDQSIVREVFHPVVIGNSTTPWSVGLVVSEAEILADSNQTTMTLIFLALLIILAISALLFFVVRKMITAPLKKTVFMIDEMSKGHLSHRLSMPGNDEISQMARAMDGFCDNLQNHVLANMQRIAQGDVSMELASVDDLDEISPAMISTVAAIRLLVADAQSLVDAAVAGRLETRADVTQHQGDFAKIVDGVNKTLDAVIKPVQEASAVLADMSAGNLKARVRGNYQGDHAAIKTALNSTLDALEAYVGEIAAVLTEMANSNMVVAISGDYRGDFAPIKKALNLIIEAFNQILSEMNVSADQVAAGSRQVSNASQALSQGTTEQAASIEELTASLSEIAGQTRQNALSANQASTLATKAQTNAVVGNQQMGSLQKAMSEINESSASISRIIKVIDDIAFQTNILALNAAVEAARAGQHGKGFAVVAEEVRNLAARSASAASETTGLIESSIGKVEVGTKIADKTALALDQIVKDVSEATSLVGSIAAASNEQASGIAQINIGVGQISAVIQANSATAEQSAAASEELSSQADLLKQMIGKFKIK